MFKYQGSRNLSPHLANNVNSLYNGIVTDASVIPRHLGTADERAKLMPDLVESILRCYWYCKILALYLIRVTKHEDRDCSYAIMLKDQRIFSPRDRVGNACKEIRLFLEQQRDVL